MEAEFAVERVPHSSELVKVARTLGLDVAEPPPAPAAAPEPAGGPALVAEKEPPASAHDRAELMRSAFGGAQSRPQSALSTQPSRRDASPVPPEPAAAPEPLSEPMPVGATAAPANPWSSDGDAVSDPQAVTLGGAGGGQPAGGADLPAGGAEAAR